MPKVLSQDGDYTAIFSELLRKSFPRDETSVKYQMDSYDVRNKLEYPQNIDEYDGIVYTGSGQSCPYLTVSRCMLLRATSNSCICLWESRVDQQACSIYRNDCEGETAHQADRYVESR